ncbi:MAG: diguanylate cyclase [Clostridiales bacterium]|nr:diguanylate cyclase [Clostridiales bacterium]
MFNQDFSSVTTPASNLITGCKNYRFHIVLNNSVIIALFGNIFLIPIYLYLGIWYLAALSFASCSSYLLCIYLVRQNKFNTVFFICLINTLSHAIIASSILGLKSGFHYIILSLIPFIFFSPISKSSIKFLISAICAFTYLFINFAFNNSTAIYTLSEAQITFFNSINILCLFAYLIFLSFSYSLAASNVEHDLLNINRKLEELASVDPLTGLINRRTMLKHIDNEIAHYQEHNKSFSIVLADMDDFKSFNDENGHECGDYILTQTAFTMKSVLREVDHIARWGGEEFLLFLPKTNIEESRAIVSRIKEKLSNQPITFKDSNFSVTLTFGICEYIEGMEIASVINIADKALYRGKNSGKNCIVYNY